MTNDAWFGDSTAPHQHLDISRMRSLESGRAMLRATNDGVTALIEHDGSLLGTLPQFQPGVLTGDVQPRTGLTPYVRFGNWPVLAVLWLGVAWHRGAAPPEQPTMSEHRGALTRRRRAVPVAATGARLPGDRAAGARPRRSRSATACCWARIPLPMELNHINVWLLRHGDGWMLVDTGLADDVCREAWHTLETRRPRRPRAAPDLRHARPSGPHGSLALAARAPRRAGVDVRDRRTARPASSSPTSPDALARRSSTRSSPRTAWRSSSRRCAEPRGSEHGAWFGGLPPLAQAAAGGERVHAAGRDWDIIETSGHCRGHLCLYDARATRC